ncbi:MAG: peroxiredoxin [Verrucomicrobiales bacterium]|jgi:peroxiredoxin
MYPHERSLVARMKDKPFTILGVNSDKADRYKKAIKENNISWPSFWDGGSTGGPIATQWAVSGWPTIYVIDAKGVIRYKNVRGEAMDEAVDALMKEMNPA